MKLESTINIFISAVTAGKTNQTPQAYRTKMQHLIRYIGESENLTQDDIDRFKIHLLTRNEKRKGGQQVKGQLSRFTIRSILATTRHFLKWANQKGYLPALALENIKEPAADPKPVQAVTVERLLASAATCGPDWECSRNCAIVYLLRDTGGRVGAIAKIDIDCLYLDDGYATAPDKNDQLSWLWFNLPTRKAIEDWLKLRYLLKPKDNLLFTGARGWGLTTQGIRRVLSKLASLAGCTGRHNPHAFRHAFARDAILAGADISQVSEMLGHKGIVVTHKYYSRWDKTEVKSFHKKFSPGVFLPLPGKGSAKP